jgi:16S rRNA C1402 N4-methylase RsmH
MNWKLAAIIFAAAVFYEKASKAIRDFNGIRRVMNEENKRLRKRITKLLKVLRTALPEEHREQIIEMLSENDE